MLFLFDSGVILILCFTQLILAGLSLNMLLCHLRFLPRLSLYVCEDVEMFHCLSLLNKPHPFPPPAASLVPPPVKKSHLYKTRICKEKDISQEETGFPLLFMMKSSSVERDEFSVVA